MRVRISALGFVLACLPACSGESAQPDIGDSAPPERYGAEDASVPDAPGDTWRRPTESDSAPDARADARDGGSRDGEAAEGSVDAGIDAPARDAGSDAYVGVDAGIDAAARDAGIDAYVGVDASPDASPRDASPPDATPPIDAGDGGLVGPHRTIQVSAGEDHTCAVRRDGHVLCWGANAFGQLGYGGDTTTKRTRPVAAWRLDAAVGVSVGDYRSCALLRSGSVSCWGFGGLLASGQPKIVETPTLVAGLTDATAVASGSAHTCAIRADKSVVCWGANDRGQLGNGATARPDDLYVETPVAVSGLTGALAIAAGRKHTCALTSAGIACWGGDQMGELGSGGVADSNVPVAVAAVPGALGLASSIATFVLRSDGDLSCWGFGTGGLRSPVGGDATAPMALGLGGVTAVSVGPTAVCRKGDSALGGANALLCRSLDGSNAAWAPKLRWATLAVSGGVVAAPTGLSVGGHHACAQFDDGIVRCWGNNASGQLGNGGFSSSSAAAPVDGF